MRGFLYTLIVEPVCYHNFTAQKHLYFTKDMESIDKILESIRELRLAQAKTDAQQAKTDAQLAETDLQLKETVKTLSNIGVNLGHVAEEFFYYALKDNPKLGDIRFDSIALNLHSTNKKIQDEFDIVLYNGDAVGLIEVKHKVHPNDIEKLKTQKAGNFRKLFPHYAGHRFYLGIAGASIPIGVANIAKAAGIAILRQKGDIAEIEADNLMAY